MTQQRSANKKSYLIIGAGWFGLRAARAIEKSFPDATVTILELGKKDYVDLNVQAPRVLVEPDFVSRAYPPISKVTNANVLHIKKLIEVASGSAVVVGMDGTKATLFADGIIVSTGAVYTSKILKDDTGKSVAERKGQLVAFAGVLSKAKNVLIVGGGSTGVEVAGEVACDFPHANVTLINKPDLLMKGCAKQKSMHKLCMKELTKLGVTVLNGDHIDGLTEDYVGAPMTYKTAKGVNVQADVVLMCTGCKPSVDFAPVEAVDKESGGLIVDGALLCHGLSSDPSLPVWAIGDCTMYGGRGSFADPQISSLKSSVAHFEKKGTVHGGPETYEHVPNESSPTVISIGRKGGAATFPCVNSSVGKFVKAPSLVVSLSMYKEFGICV